MYTNADGRMLKDDKFLVTHLATVLIRAPNTPPLALDRVLLMVCCRDTSLSDTVSDIYQPHNSCTTTRVTFQYYHRATRHTQHSNALV